MERAYEAWEYLMLHNVLTSRVILNAHGILMKGDPVLQPFQIGRLRQEKVWVNQRETPPPAVLRLLLQEWCFENMRLGTRVNPVHQHIMFELIHPFVDGNGRIGRLLMNWQNVKVLHRPLIVIRAEDRPVYLSWFN